MALVNQRYGRQGNANYVFYPLAAQTDNACVSNAAAAGKTTCIFYDIQTGNNSVVCQGGTPDYSNTSTASGQFGVMVSGTPRSSAYTTTAGYDLATGLGSVNAANLVNNWTSISFNPTTTTLSPIPSATPVTLTHGQPFNFNVTVAPGSGSVTPSGDVSLIAQNGNGPSNATGIGPFTLGPAASVTSSTLMLPGGSYNVTARYAGNGTFAASSSSPGLPVVVSPENSQTFVHLVTFDANGNITSTNAATASYGSQYLLRMDVTNSSGNSCASATNGLTNYPCPTGALTVSPAPTDVNPPLGITPGHYTLNSQGYAEDQLIQQSPGVYNFAASYAGDNSYNSSHSSATITITLQPTTTNFDNQATATIAGTTTMFEPYITTQQSIGIAPGGTVQYYMEGAPFGSPVPVSGTPYHVVVGYPVYAAATALSQETLPIGTNTFTAQYSGDINYAPSTSAPVTLTVTDFSVSANPPSIVIAAPGQSGTSTISITPINGFTGTINLNMSSWLGSLPSGAAFTLSPLSLAINGSSTVTSTLTITTTGASSAAPAPKRRVPPSIRLQVGLPWLLAGSLVLAMLLGSSATRRHPAALLIATTLLVVGVWVACGGGGGGGGGTPPTPTPGVSLSPTSLSFGSQVYNTSSVAQNVTLSNTGTAALSILNVGLSGTNAPDFAQTNTCGSSLSIGANCSISVKFTPIDLGVLNAFAVIDDNASGSPQMVSLSGTSVLPPTPAGTYPFLVIGFDSTAADTHSITVYVTVQ